MDDLPTPSLVLVEDNPGDVALVRCALETCGSEEPIVFRDGQAAIDFITGSSCPYRALFMVDLNLPRRNGFDVLSALSHSLAARKCQAIVLSSTARPAERERALALGARKVLAKPDSLEAIQNLGREIYAILKVVQNS